MAFLRLGVNTVAASDRLKETLDALKAKQAERERIKLELAKKAKKGELEESEGSKLRDQLPRLEPAATPFPLGQWQAAIGWAKNEGAFTRYLSGDLRQQVEVTRSFGDGPAVAPVYTVVWQAGEDAWPDGWFVNVVNTEQGWTEYARLRIANEITGIGTSAGEGSVRGTVHTLPTVGGLMECSILRKSWAATGAVSVWAGFNLLCYQAVKVRWGIGEPDTPEYAEIKFNDPEAISDTGFIFNTGPSHSRTTVYTPGGVFYEDFASVVYMTMSTVQEITPPAALLLELEQYVSEPVATTTSAVSSSVTAAGILTLEGTEVDGREYGQVRWSYISTPVSSSGSTQGLTIPDPGRQNYGQAASYGIFRGTSLVSDGMGGFDAVPSHLTTQPIIFSSWSTQASSGTTLGTPLSFASLRGELAAYAPFSADAALAREVVAPLSGADLITSGARLSLDAADNPYIAFTLYPSNSTFNQDLGAYSDPSNFLIDGLGLPTTELTLALAPPEERAVTLDDSLGLYVGATFSDTQRLQVAADLTALGFEEPVVG